MTSYLSLLAVVALGTAFNVIAVSNAADVASNVIAPWAPGLINLGVAGYMIWWFTHKHDRSLERLVAAVQMSNRTELLKLSVHKLASEDVKAEAVKMIKEIDRETPQST